MIFNLDQCVICRTCVICSIFFY